MAGLTGKANTLAPTIRSSAGPQTLFALAFALVEDQLQPSAISGTLTGKTVETLCAFSYAERLEMPRPMYRRSREGPTRAVGADFVRLLYSGFCCPRIAPGLRSGEVLG